jgi:eukaryotic-like serine/threonine-protein kinase
VLSTNTLGRYHIIRELARSNDIVYEAMDPARGKRIALKELQVPPNLTGTARRERIERFTREARAAARLRHTNVVQIFDHGQVEGRYYIAMEFLEGQSLRDVMRQRSPFPAGEALRIAAAVADGLEFAHRNHVVHRDVKPDNVHLEPDGRVVITDFGIARLTFEPTLTADGQIFGTPSYMSPEQVTGKNVDKRTDIFSLGVMLYEMIAGRKPFTGDSVITITYNIMNADAPPVGSGPQGIEAILRCAMAKDPSMRYRSAADLAEDIRAVSQGGRPRHAAAIPVAPAARPASPPAPAARPAPGPAPGPVRRMPQPVFGTPGAGGGYMPPPGGAPVPAGMSAAMPRGVVAAAPSAGAPGGFVAPRSRRVHEGSGGQALWLLGWFGVALIIGLLILAGVWSAVTAYDTANKQRISVEARALQDAADKAFKEGRYEDALKEYEIVVGKTNGPVQAVARQSGARAAEAVAEARLAKNDFAEAEQFVEKAIKLDPNAPNAYVVMGKILDRQGRVDEAVRQFDLAKAAAERAQAAGVQLKDVEVTAKNAHLWKADALYRDGLTQLKADKLEKAKDRFLRAIEAAPNTEFSSAALKQLDQLGGPGTASVYSNGPSPARANDPLDINPADLPGYQGLPPSSTDPFPPAPAMPAPGQPDTRPMRPRGWTDNYSDWGGRGGSGR